MGWIRRMGRKALKELSPGINVGLYVMVLREECSFIRNLDGSILPFHRPHDLGSILHHV